MYEQLIAVESIPPLPATAATLLAMAADPDVEIEALALVIERDPPLNARLLGIANSAFYAPRQPVMTAKDDIIRVLGLNMVRTMAIEALPPLTFSRCTSCPGLRGLVMK